MIGEVPGPQGSTFVHRLYQSFADWGWKMGREGAFAKLVRPKLLSLRYGLQGKHSTASGLLCLWPPLRPLPQKRLGRSTYENWL